MPPLEIDIVLKRVAGIEQDLAELEKLGEQSLADFSTGSGHKLAEYHLHRVLEGVFNIASHINSRKAGGSGAMSYKDVAKMFGELGFIDLEFANTKLLQMAGYRNRLVHFYAEIENQELYDLLHNSLVDIQVFLSAVRLIVKQPQKYGLEV